MLKRLWLLISVVWALVFLLSGTTRVVGILPDDIALAAAPFVIGWLFARAARFVVTGSFRLARVRIHR